MDIKKVSKTVRKRIRKKARLQGIALNETNSADASANVQTPSLPQKEFKPKSMVEATADVYTPSLSQKKLKHKRMIEATANAQTPVLSEKQLKKKKIIEATHSKPVLAAPMKQKHVPKSRVVYINRNYGGNDPNSIGAQFQAELIELRKQSEHIKNASDLTESQAHVIKRQITRLQAVEKKKVFKRKRPTKSLDQAAKELALIMKKHVNQK